MTSCPQLEPSMASAFGGLALASFTRCSPCLPDYQISSLQELPFCITDLPCREQSGF